MAKKALHVHTSGRENHSLQGYQLQKTNSVEARRRQLARSLCHTASSSVVADYRVESTKLDKLLENMDIRLQGLIDPQLKSLIEALGFPLGEDTAASVIKIVDMVSTALQANEDRKLTLDNLIQILLRTSDPPSWELKQGTFTLLGVLTMLYSTPRLPSSEEIFIEEPFNPLVDITRMYLRSTASIPLGIIIAGLGRFVPKILSEDERPWQIKEPDTQYLDAAKLSAFSLINLGEVHVNWSDLLSTHLMYDQPTRTLTLFRFPSFCAINYVKERKASFFDW